MCIFSLRYGKNELIEAEGMDSSANQRSIVWREIVFLNRTRGRSVEGGREDQRSPGRENICLYPESLV